MALEQLPSELVHVIAFQSLNPNIYLTSNLIRSRLLPQTLFLQDIALMALCDFYQSNSVWYTVSTLPWRTGPARNWNLTMQHHERENFQRQLFSLEYITSFRLTRMISFVLRLHTEVSQMCETPAGGADHMQSPSVISYPANGRNSRIESGQSYKFAQVEKVPPKEPILLCGRIMPATSHGQTVKTAKFIISILHVPTRLLSAEEGTDGEALGRMLLEKTAMDSLNHSIVKKYIATAKPKWMHV